MHVRNDGLRRRLGPAHVVPAPTAEARRWRAALGRALADPAQPNLVFQPIVDLCSGAVAGYEALARFDGPPHASPDRWFAAAARAGVGVRLEARVLRAALQALPDLPPGRFLSVNLSPGVVSAPAVDRLLRRAAPLDGLVLELTEQTDIGDYDALLVALDRHRAAGLTVAVDDAGQGYAGLHRLLRVRPDLVKLDRTITAGADRDSAKLALAALLRDCAQRLDAALVVEGIETRRELEAFVGLGVTLGQGNLLGRGGATWTTTTPAVTRLIRAAVDRRAADPDVALGLLEHVPAVAGASARDRFVDEPGLDLLVIVDDGDRPVGLLERAAALRGEGWRDVQCVGAAMPLAELATRSMTRDQGLRFDPSACCDGDGRYLGIVRVERVVTWLADRERPAPAT